MVNMTNEDAIRTIYANLWQDPALRVKAMSDGNAAVEEILGCPVRDVKVVFHENSDTVVHLPLPVRPQELNNRDLNAMTMGKAPGGERGIFDIVKKVLPVVTHVVSGINNVINK